MSAEVLVVTVAFRSDAYLPTLAESILAATTRAARLVIVNNADTPVAPFPPPASLLIDHVDAPENPGYGGGINRGAATLAGERWLVIANPDLRFAPGSIDTLIDALGDDDGIGMVGPLIRTPAGEIYPSARSLPSLRTGVGHALFGLIAPGNRWTRRYLADRDEPPHRREAGWLSGSCIVMRSEVFAAIGGFDESYFMYFEDVDLGRRVGERGLRIVYEPKAEIVHVGGESTKTASRAMIVAHHDSAYRYLSRKYRGPLLLPVRVTLHAGLWLRGRLVRR